MLNRRQAAAAVLYAGMVVAATQVAASTHDAAASCRYQAGGVLPDRLCTPGARNPAVTQRTVGSTICRAGWTRTVRPSSAVIEPLKLRSMRQYGVDGVAAFEYDHLIPLELGGHPSDPANLWPEPYAGDAGARTKDLVENRLKRDVCAGRLTLRRAQRQIASDWRLAGRLP